MTADELKALAREYMQDADYADEAELAEFVLWAYERDGTAASYDEILDFIEGRRHGNSQA